MFAATFEPIRPAGTLVHTGTTTGATFRYRAGEPVEIWHLTERFGTGVFRVFIGGRFAGGWGSLEVATARAARY